MVVLAFEIKAVEQKSFFPNHAGRTRAHFMAFRFSS